MININKLFRKLVLLGMLMLLITLGAKQLNYNWHWSQVPKYFLNYDTSVVTAENDGIVNAIKINGKNAQITIATPAGDENYKVSSADLYIDINDDIFAGDELGAVNHWQVGSLSKGMFTTVALSAVATILGLLLGTIVALLRYYKISFCEEIIELYVGLIRGTPLLVQLFVLYFLFGSLFNLSRISAAVFALSIFAGAYFCEIIRAGLNSVAPGIIDSAKTLGFNPWQRAYNIVLPIVFKRQLPALINQAINIIKDSSLVSVIAVTDLTKAGREIIAANFNSFEIWLVVAALYLMLTISLAQLAKVFEQRWQFDD